MLKCKGLHTLFTAIFTGLQRRIYNLMIISQSVFNRPDRECEITIVLDVYCPQNGSCVCLTLFYVQTLYLLWYSAILNGYRKEMLILVMRKGFGKGYRILPSSEGCRSWANFLFDPTLRATSQQQIAVSRNLYFLPIYLIHMYFKGILGQVSRKAYMVYRSQHCLIFQVEILFNFFFINIFSFAFHICKPFSVDLNVKNIKVAIHYR